MKGIVLVFVTYLVVATMYAQGQDTLPAPLGADSDTSATGTVGFFHDYFMIKAKVNNSSLNLGLSPRVNSINQIFKLVLYRPSVLNVVGAEVHFKGFALGFGTKVAQHPLVKAREGTSQYFDFRVHSYGKKLGYDIYYQDYEGYFISDLDDFFTNFLSGTSLRRRDDLQLRNISANVFYVFNADNFSYRAAFVHDERQLKSAGSFILTASAGYTTAKGDSTIVPTDTDITFDPRSFYSNAKFYTLAIVPGVAYNWVKPSGFYISASASGMLGMHYFEAGSETLNDSGLNLMLKGIGRFSIGFNKENWVYGASGSADVQGMNTRFVEFRTINLDATLFVAYRFKTKWMAGRKTIFNFTKNKS